MAYFPYSSALTPSSKALRPYLSPLLTNNHKNAPAPATNHYLD